MQQISLIKNLLTQNIKFVQLMGCGASDESPKVNFCSDDLYAQNFKVVEIPNKKGPKREQFMRDPKFSEADYNKIWGILRHDRIDALVIFMEEQKKIFDPFIEISTYRDNEYWNFVHFCCKHNAFRCLQWILTDAFYQEPENYIDFVNAKNSDDQTPLAIALCDKNAQCYNTLFKFGGINLRLKCKNQTYIQVASLNRQYDIWKKLKKLQEMQVYHLKVHDEQFNIQSLSKALSQSKQQATNRIQQQNLKFNVIKTAELINKEADQGQKQKKQENSEKEIQQLKKLKVAFQQRKKEADAQNQKKQEQERRKLEQEKQKIAQEEYARKKVQMEARQKQEAEKRKIRLQRQQKLQEEQIRQQKIQQDKKIKEKNQQRAQALSLAEKQRLIQKARAQQQIRAQLIQKQKGIINQSREQIVNRVNEQNVIIKQAQKKKDQVIQKRAQAESSPAARKHGELSKIPQDLQNMYNGIKTGVTFKDMKFPSTASSLGNPLPENMNSAVWLRPHQIFGTTEFKLFDGIDPNDITQGSLGVCYYLSTISCLAQNPKRIENLFAFADIDKGFYVLRFYTTGRQDYIVVDDYFPCSKMNKSPLFTKPRGLEVWVMVLQKAWVKQFGSYISAEAMSPDMMMQNVTGAPSQGIWIQKHTKEQIFEMMKFHDQNNGIMVLTSHSKIKIAGIVASHAYSLISVYQIKQGNKTHQIYKIRNPWGKFEWEGQYSDKSTKWTPQIKKKVGFQQSNNDGVFYMSVSQLSTAFCYISIGMVKNGYQTSMIDLKTTADDMFYQLKVTKPGPLNLRVCQPFKRFAPSLNPSWKNYEYSPFIFEIFHLQSKKFLQQGENASNFGAKAVNCNEKGFMDVQPGTILIRIKLFPKMNPIPKMSLCAYASQKLQLKQANLAKSLENWQQCMANFMSSQIINPVDGQSGYALKWIKGQLLVYVKSQPSQTINIILDKNTLKNCKPGYLTDKNQAHTLSIGNGRVGTVDKIVIKDACTTGSFSVNVKK